MIYIIGLPDDDSTGSYDRGENSPLYCIYLHDRHAGTPKQSQKSTLHKNKTQLCLCLVSDSITSLIALLLLLVNEGTLLIAGCTVLLYE